MFGIRFGSVQSLKAASAGFRYLRFQFDAPLASATSFFANNLSGDPANRFGFVTPGGLLPVNLQTSATNPLVVTESSAYGGYDSNAGWRLFAASVNAWTDTPNSAPKPWVTVDFGEVIDAAVTGVRTISSGDALPNSFSVYKSLTGEFAGEEILVGSKSGFVWKGSFEVQDFTF